MPRRVRKDRKLHFPLLADFEPKGAVARSYGAFRAPEGVSERALFVLDADGVIRWSYVSPVGVNPGADGILAALEALPKPGRAMSAAAGPQLKPPVSDRDHAQGPADAKLTLVEYGDYECPHCGRAYPIVKAVQKRLGSRLRFVFRNFPLNNAHPHAQAAAEAAEAAAAQGKFWEMHDAIFENQGALETDDLLRYAEDLGLDVERFASELDREVHGDRGSRRTSGAACGAE